MYSTVQKVCEQCVLILCTYWPPVCCGLCAVAEVKGGG